MTVQVTPEDWARLSPMEFETLCFDLLRALGYKNVELNGGPGDQGCDINCQLTFDLGLGRSLTFSVIVQCKHWKDGRLRKAQIYDSLVAAAQHRPDYWLLMTTGHVTSAAKDWLRRLEHNPFPFRLGYLDRSLLSAGAGDFPRIVAGHFPWKLRRKDREVELICLRASNLLSEGAYEAAVQILEEADDGNHPRLAYLLACGWSLRASLEAQGPTRDQALRNAFTFLEETKRRGLIPHLESAMQWTERRTLAYVHGDPDLRFIRANDLKSFSEVFPDTGVQTCCIAGTKVAVGPGRDIAIERLVAGDLVSGPDRMNRVRYSFNSIIKEAIRLNGRLVCTPNHRILTPKGWCQAAALVPGDHVLGKVSDDALMDLGIVLVTSVETHRADCQVVGLAVEPTPEFIADGFLVHNDK